MKGDTVNVVAPRPWSLAPSASIDPFVCTSRGCSRGARLIPVFVLTERVGACVRHVHDSIFRSDAAARTRDYVAEEVPGYVIVKMMIGCSSPLPLMLMDSRAVP